MPWSNLPPGNDKHTNTIIRKIKLKVQHYPKDSMKNPVMPINKFSSVPRYKTSADKSVVFLYNKQSEIPKKEIWENDSIYNNIKNLLKNELNQGG